MDLEDHFLGILERWWSSKHTERHGLVSSYDPSKYLAKVVLQPGGQETGWLPIETGHIGSTYGIVVGLQPGQGGANAQGQGGQAGPQSQNQGDQVIVQLQEGDFESGKIVQRVHSDQDNPPQAQSGEIRIWTKFQKSGGSTPDAAPSGKGGTGQEHYFKNDGSLTHTDGNGATTVYDGNGNKTNTSQTPGNTQTNQVTQGQGSPPGGGGLGDIGSQLSGMIGQLSAFASASVGLPAITSIGSQLSSTDMSSAISGAGGSSDIATQISSIGSQISQLTSITGLSSLVTSLSTQLSNLTSMLGSGAQVLHMHVLDRTKGITTSAFQSQHTTTWDQNGITHSSSTAVTSQAPKIPHNGLILGSDGFTLSGQMTALGFTTSSDAKLKSNVKDYVAPLDRVMQIKVKTFDKRRLVIDGGKARIHGDPPKPSMGVIAQEFEQLFPELVGDCDGFKTVNENGIAFITLDSLQQFVREMRAEIADLKKQLAAK